MVAIMIDRKFSLSEVLVRGARIVLNCWFKRRLQMVAIMIDRKFSLSEVLVRGARIVLNCWFKRLLQFGDQTNQFLAVSPECFTVGCRFYELACRRLW